MKFFSLCIVLLILVSCKQQLAANTNATNCTTSEVMITDAAINGINSETLLDNDPVPDKLSGEKEFTIEALLGDTLVPMEITDGENENPFRKYGFAFSANCYGCDGINIFFTGSVINLIGACSEEMLSEKLEVETITKNANHQLILETKNVKFIFNKVDDIAEVYKLIIEGNLNLEKGDHMTRDYFNSSIDFYYTPYKELHKFSVYDCGDFDG